MAQTTDKDVRREHFFRRRTANFIIANGATTSNFVDVRKGCETLVGLIFPAAFTGATISFQVAPPDINNPVNADFLDFYDDIGALITVTVTVGVYVNLSPSLFAGIRHVRIVSAGAEAAIRRIQGVIRPV